MSERRVRTAFPCTYPGRYHTFSVRSNAKRHLRTHGIVPNDASPVMASASRNHSPAMNPQDGSYIVSFHEPILVGGSVPRAAAAPAQNIHDIEAEKSAAESSGGGGRASKDRTSAPPTTNPGPPFYKVRWLPLSRTSRIGATAAVRSQQMDKDQESGRSVNGFGDESGSEGKCAWPSYTSSQYGSLDGAGGLAHK